MRIVLCVDFGQIDIFIGMDMTTPQDKDRGYEVCKCGCVKLLQAGFDVQTHYYCQQCAEHVADKDEFFKNIEDAKK